MHELPRSAYRRPASDCIVLAPTAHADAHSRSLSLATAPTATEHRTVETAVNRLPPSLVSSVPVPVSNAPGGGSLIGCSTVAPNLEPDKAGARRDDEASLKRPTTRGPLHTLIHLLARCSSQPLLRACTSDQSTASARMLDPEASDSDSSAGRYIRAPRRFLSD